MAELVGWVYLAKNAKEDGKDLGDDVEAPSDRTRGMNGQIGKGGCSGKE